MRFLDRFRGSGAAPVEILEKELLVLTPDTSQEPGVEVLKESREVPVVLVLDEEGLPVLPAFTSEAALVRWKPQGSAFVALPGDVLVEMLAGSEWDRMIIDGADKGAFAITRADARKLVGSSAYSMPAGSFRIGQPAEPPPDGFAAALRRVCEREPTVEEAYLYQFQSVERGEAPYMAIGLRLHPSVDEP